MTTTMTTAMTTAGKDKAAIQYLARHAETEADLALQFDWPALHRNKANHYEHSLVVPACRETLAGLNRIWPRANPQILQILVINSAEADAATTELLTQLTAEATQRREHLYVVPREHGPDQLVIDRCRAPRQIPHQQGVGLARKIGADIALALHYAGHVASPLINTTDADVVLPGNYFDHSVPGARTAALCRPFIHTADKSVELAALLYDTAMHFYVLGLRSAGSPHAYHAIGSTLSIHAPHYARARGFPKKNAAEDFYLLNKLAKLGDIHSCTGNEPGEGLIRIDARLSDRAPFGTGSALRKIQQLTAPLDEYLFYHPTVFTLLGVVLKRTRLLRDQTSADVFSDTPILAEWASDSGLNGLVERHIDRRQPAHVFERMMLDWLDGFRTLKLIHFLRDHYLPSQPLAAICDGELLPELAMTEPADLRRLNTWLRQKMWARIETD